MQGRARGLAAKTTRSRDERNETLGLGPVGLAPPVARVSSLGWRRTQRFGMFRCRGLTSRPCTQSRGCSYARTHLTVLAVKLGAPTRAKGSHPQYADVRECARRVGARFVSIVSRVTARRSSARHRRANNATLRRSSNRVEHSGGNLHHPLQPRLKYAIMRLHRLSGVSG
jgi:hypothetical protein